MSPPFNRVFISHDERRPREGTALAASSVGERQGSEDRALQCLGPRVTPRGSLRRSLYDCHGTQSDRPDYHQWLTWGRPSGGGQGMSGFPISQWWPKGSAILPRRQPCASPTGYTSVAPAALARSTAESGSSTIKSIRTVPPPTDSGLKFACGGDSSETQNVALPTASSATTSGDRKSTRLNSSHVKISYAVFCL